MKKYVKIFATMTTGIALIFGAFASCSNSSDGGTSGGGAGESADANYIVTITTKNNDYLTKLEKDGSLNLPADVSQRFFYTLIAKISPPNGEFTSQEMIAAVYGAEWEWELYYGKSITPEAKKDLNSFKDIEILTVKDTIQFSPIFPHEGKESSNGEYTLLAKAYFKKDGKTTLLGTGTIKLNVSGFKGI